MSPTRKRPSENDDSEILKKMRMEVKEMKVEMVRQKLEFLEENMEIRERMGRMETQIASQKERICNLEQQIADGKSKTEILIPIKEAIIGAWKMMEHEHSEGWKCGKFSKNVKYSLKNGGKVCESRVNFSDLVEGGSVYGEKDLFVEEDHLKTIHCPEKTTDRFIVDGKLHIVRKYRGQVLSTRSVPQNCHFLGEMAQLRAETDEIREALVPKTVKNELLEEIMGQLRTIRAEIKEIDKKNEKKLEEMKKEMLQKMEENKKEIRQNLIEEIAKNRRNARDIPIREAISGEWKMVEHENYDGAHRYFGWKFELFSVNVKYVLEGDKLIDTFAPILAEGGHKFGNDLYVEGNHVKSFFFPGGTIDRYIEEDGRLHVVWNWDEEVFKRIYEKL